MVEASIVVGTEPYTGDKTYTVKYRKAGEKHWTYLPGYTKNVDVAKEVSNGYNLSVSRLCCR